MRWFHAFGIAAIVLVGILLIYNLVYFPQAARGLVPERIAELKANGEPLSLTELSYAELTDSSNAAVVYADLLEKLRHRGQTEDINLLWLVSRDESRGGLKYELSARAPEIINRYEAVFSEIEKAASMPNCKFPLSWQGWNLQSLSPGIKTYDVRYLTVLANAAAARAVLSAKSGDMNDAYHWTNVAFKVAESLKDGRMADSQHVRHEVMSAALRGLDMVCGYGYADGPERKALDHTLAQINLMPASERAVKAERALVITRLKDQAPEGRFYYPAALYLIDYWSYFDKVSHLKFRQIDRHRLENGNIQAYAQSRLGLGRTYPYAHAMSSRDTSEAEVDMARIRLTAMAFRHRFGSYPDSLGQLAARMHWSAPSDPFSGKPFIYKRRGKGFILYSIGPNLIDDGGNARQRATWTEGDIVSKAAR